MRNRNSRSLPPDVTTVALGRQLGGLFLLGTMSFLIACGSDQPRPPPHMTPTSPPPTPAVTVFLDEQSYLLGLGEKVSAVARVTGTETPVTWTLDCESGQASIVPSGNSAMITALASGTCFLSATEGELWAAAIIQIPPLAPGDPCTNDSQCSQDAPKCGLAVPPCGKTCTLVCTTDADCPLLPSGQHVACEKQLCHFVGAAADWSCP